MAPLLHPGGDGRLSRQAIGRMIQAAVAAGPKGGASDHAATMGIRSTLRQGARSACMALLSDSTGTDLTEWFGILGQRLADEHPAYTLLWRPWNTTTQDYDYPTRVSEGTGNGGGERGLALTSGTMKHSTNTTYVADQDVRAKFSPAAGWAPGTGAAVRTILSRYNASGSNRGWIFFLDPTGRLGWTWSANGTADAATVFSTASVPFTGTQKGLVRVTFDVDNNATGNTATFYTSTDGTTWTQLGAPVVTAGVTSISTGTADFQIGSHNSGFANFLDATFYWAEVRPGTLGANGQPVIASPLPEDWEQATTSTSVSAVGAPNLLLLAGAASGQNIAYFNDSTRRLRLNAPHGQDVLFLSTNHNEGNVSGLQWISTYSTWVTDLKTRVPLTPIVAVTQNPTTAPIGAQQVDARRQRGSALLTYAASQPGVYGLDTYRAFPLTPTAVQVEASDGVHPTPQNVQRNSGSDLWADFVYENLFAS